MAHRTSSHHACNDFHRTAGAERERFLGAAGALSRRQFIGWGFGAGLTVYASQAFSLARVLDVGEAAAASDPQSRVLVSVFLPGGTDLLDTLIPSNQQAAYQKHRGAQAVKLSTKLGNTGLSIHNSLTSGAGGGVKGLFDRGQVGFMPGIDYANPDLSHFKSRAFWETGLVSANSASGWLGRWLDVNGSKDNPLQGVALGYSLNPVLRSGGAPVAAFESPANVNLLVRDVGGTQLERTVAAYDELGQRISQSVGPDAAYRATRLTSEIARRLKGFDAPTRGGGAVGLLQPATGSGYPNTRLAGRLSSLAALITAGYGVRIAAVNSESDFDTHGGQALGLSQGLTEVSEALSSFQADLEARGLSDRVLTFVWSEFGRRPAGNQSAGTDHGAGGLAWIQGATVNPGILSEYPSLTDLDARGNLKVTIDFRAIYSSLIEQWLNSDPAAVIPDASAFPRIKLVR